MIFRFVRPSKLNEWLKNNFPTSLVGTAGDNWKKFLTSQGATGSTFHDLEQSYLASQGSFASTIVDRWSKFVSSATYTGQTVLQNIRNYFDGIVDTGQPGPVSGQPIGAGDYLFITYT